LSNGIKNKLCKGCKEAKPTSEFTRSTNTRDGFEGKCKNCRQNDRRKFKNKCFICEKHFKTANKGTRCCSYACIGKLRTMRYTARTTCGTCGEVFRIEISAMRTTNFCSNKCFSKGTSKRMVGLNTKRITVNCDYCGRQFHRVASHARRIKKNFCDMGCFSKGIGKYRRDENLSDEERQLKRNYPEYKRWRSEVLLRDGFQCIKCGDSDDNLHAHHIYNYSSHPKLRTDVSNGVTLCSTCHIDFHVLYGFINNNKEQLSEFLKIGEEVEQFV